MKKIHLIILGIICVSCSAPQGLYRHNICKYGPNCFKYCFKTDGRFEYIYSQHMIGSGKINGTWTMINNEVKLIPEFEHKEKSSHILESKSSVDNELTFRIFLLRPEGDTLMTSWFVKLNDSKDFLETDSTGTLTLNRQPITKLTAVDYFTYKKFDIGRINIMDSVFNINYNQNSNYNVFIAEKNSSPITDWMTKDFKVKGRKLVPLTFEPEVAFLGERKTFYKKVSNKCK